MSFRPVEHGLGSSLLLYMFPLGNRTWNDAKKRMCQGKANVNVAPINRRTAPLQLSQQPPPFVLQLPIGHQDPLCRTNPTKLGAIKCVAPITRFGVDECKVTVDGCAR